MTEYESGFQPAAPVASISLRNQSGTLIAGVQMLLDSGSDLTLIPRRAAERVGMDIDQEEVYQLMAFAGKLSMAKAAHGDVVFLEKTFRGRYLLTEENIGILGCDILN